MSDSQTEMTIHHRGLRLARERVLQRLYGEDLIQGEMPAGFQWPNDQDLTEAQKNFGEQMVLGIRTHQPVIDQWIQTVSPHWKLNRMGAIDRAILRMGTFEILFSPETGAEVIINEAVELARNYGSEDSYRFVNGLLQEILNRKSEMTTSVSNA